MSDFENIEAVKSFEEFRISSTKPRKPIEELLKIKGNQTLTYGNLSIVGGPAKARKTFFLRAIATAVITGTWYGLIEARQSTLGWFDTEQSEGHAGRVYDSIAKEINNTDPFDYFSLRGLEPKEIQVVINNYLIANLSRVIIIDGIGDLLLRANDEEESAKLVTWLMNSSQQLNIHIILILHVNYDSPKLRGHIGSMLERKCEQFFLVSKDGDKSIVSSKLARNEGFEDFSFYIENGFPVTDAIPEFNKHLKPLKEVAPSYYDKDINFDTNIDNSFPF